MRIRAYRPADAEALAQLFRRSVLGLGPRDYSAMQVAAWASVTPSAERLAARLADGRSVFVAVDDGDQPLGFVDLEDDGHIDLFYCAPEVAGKGTAAAIYAALEHEARRRGLRRLYAEASEAARRFLLRHGFMEIKRRDLVVAGVPIHNFAMEKHLPD